MATKRGQFYFNPTIKKSHGRHAKSKTSFNKGSKNYIKKSRGQG
jgi:hypothetical protein